MKPRKKKNKADTTISLHPLSFQEAIRELAHVSKHGDSQAEGSCNTNEDAPESETLAKKTVPHLESSGD